MRMCVHLFYDCVPVTMVDVSHITNVPLPCAQCLCFATSLWLTLFINKAKLHILMHQVKFIILKLIDMSCS